MIKTSYLADTARDMKPSGIRKFFDLAAGMKGVVSLGVGEPDFVTPWSYREAAILSLEEGYTSYTANAGLLELREEIAAYMSERFHVDYAPENQIIVTVGASQALDIALRAIINPGEEVIVVEPCFVSYAPLVTMAGGKCITVGTSKESGLNHGDTTILLSSSLGVSNIPSCLYFFRIKCVVVEITESRVESFSETNRATSFIDLPSITTDKS